MEMRTHAINRALHSSVYHSGLCQFITSSLNAPHGGSSRTPRRPCLDHLAALPFRVRLAYRELNATDNTGRLTDNERTRKNTGLKGFAWLGDSIQEDADGL